MAVWLPTWSTDLVQRRARGSRDRAGRCDRRPVLLVANDRQRQVVVRCCERASDAGVRVGMPLAQARALFDADALSIGPYDHAGDRVALSRLAVWAQRLSPVVAVDEHGDGLLLDVTGCERVFGGEKELVQDAVRGLGQLGFRSRAAIALSFGCAWAVSRYGADPCTIVDQGNARFALSSLPIASLRIGDDVSRQLAHVGINRVGQLLEMPRSALPARFGGELLLRLDQALGQAIETIEPVRPVPPPAVERVFDGPTDKIEAIELTVRELVIEIACELQRRSCGARSLGIELVRSDLEPERLSITLGRPSRDAKHLLTLVRPKLERAHLGFGVEIVRVRVPMVGAIRHEQLEQVGGAGATTAAEVERSYGELLDTISNRLGDRRVLHAEHHASHLPERAFVMSRATGSRSMTTMKTAEVPVRDRPSVLFDRPMPAEVIALTPDGPVHRVSWNGADLTVAACVGPERIGGEWWRARDTTRDYFAVRVEDGRWLWLVRGIESGKWFVHGMWA
ncbi:MAG: DNA polymerase Y family protein [Planctomycetota bacterium]